MQISPIRQKLCSKGLICMNLIKLTYFYSVLVKYHYKNRNEEILKESSWKKSWNWQYIWQLSIKTPSEKVNKVKMLFLSLSVLYRVSQNSLYPKMSNFKPFFFFFFFFFTVDMFKYVFKFKFLLAPYC